jgi:predicted acylesterase/phospholipase RssA
MSPRFSVPSISFDDAYSPQRRTALLLTGVGTAGAYHAGVLRALHEAGVKLDVVAGRGIGAVGALFAAIDGGASLWDDRGFWQPEAVRRFYDWRLTLRLGVLAVAVSAAIVVVPVALVALGLVVFPIDFVVRTAGLGGASGLVGAYLDLAQGAFAPAGFPTWLPRLVVLVLGTAAAAAAVAGALTVRRRRERGSIWWKAIRAPMSPKAAGDRCWRVLWDLLRGAAQLKQPPPEALAERYTEVLRDNIGQPGFRELVIVVHDLDAHRDLVFALVAEGRRRDLVRRASSAAAEERQAEVVDLAGVGRVHLADAVAASLSVPIATEPHAITFEPDAFWRGETHRLCDRPESVARLFEELAALGVEQAIVVSAAPEVEGPHALAAGRLDGRGRLGEYLQSSEAAALRDAVRAGGGRLARLFTIQPTHNPVGPFDFAGAVDDRSDRRQPLAELLRQGYEDGYHQFVEPVLGASGERVGEGAG